MDAHAKHAGKQLANGEEMKKNLIDWQFGLPRSVNKNKMMTAVNLINGLVEDGGRIQDPPSGMRVYILPDGYNIWQRAVAKQKGLDDGFETELNNLHKHYILNLRKEMEVARTNGLMPEVRAIEEEIEGCGGDGRSLLEHFGVGK